MAFSAVFHESVNRIALVTPDAQHHRAVLVPSDFVQERALDADVRVVGHAGRYFLNSVPHHTAEKGAKRAFRFLRSKRCFTDSLPAERLVGLR